MTKYAPTFWEVSIDPAILEDVLVDPISLDEILAPPPDESVVQAKEQHKQEAMAVILELIQTQLTPRQREIVWLYFYEDKTQQEIAAELRINQQVVSKHLFGVVRDGRKVGGALKKLRKLCEKRGVDPQKWV